MADSKAAMVAATRAIVYDGVGAPWVKERLLAMNEDKLKDGSVEA